MALVAVATAALLRLALFGQGALEPGEGFLELSATAPWLMTAAGGLLSGLAAWIGMPAFERLAGVLDTLVDLLVAARHGRIRYPSGSGEDPAPKAPGSPT